MAKKKGGKGSKSARQRASTQQLPAENTGSPEKVMVRVQPHGGALQDGNPGNAGGPGRPDMAVRVRARTRWAEIMDKVDKKVTDKTGVGTLLAVADQYAQVGGLKQHKVVYGAEADDDYVFEFPKENAPPDEDGPGGPPKT